MFDKLRINKVKGLYLRLLLLDKCRGLALKKSRSSYSHKNSTYYFLTDQPDLPTKAHLFTTESDNTIGLLADRENI